jgi:uncharacterized protein (TIGR03089 family)
VTRLLTEQLRRRARTSGPDPLVTYYDLDTGERTELSATSFLNWVDKTSNLFTDELLLEPGAVVDLELARTAPGHWVTLVITMAAWQVGARVSVGASGQAGEPDLLVLGPDWSVHDRSAADTVIACSLHPLGLGFNVPMPPDVLDFTLEVRGQSDLYSPGARSGAELAWVDPARRLSQADLARADLVSAELISADREQQPPSGAQPSAARRVVTVGEAWPTIRDGLVVPVLTGGSAVLVTGRDMARLPHIAETERAELPG